MSAPLNASATTVGSLLSNLSFEIPAYQREYAWESSQVTDFWNDLSASVSKGPYFLGLIILTGEGKRKQVVDGQQRLLTITLLAAALRHSAVAIGRKALADRLNSTLLRFLDYATDEIYPRIILTDPRANQTLQKIIDTGSAATSSFTSGSSSERLWSAYQKLSKELPQDDSSEAFRQLGAWAEFINEQLYVAVFEHPDEAAAYSVFEVVNTRGRQLTTADLLKNYILRNTPEESRASRYDEWYKMAQEFEELGNQNFVLYIRHVINLTAGYILAKDLYNYIAKRGEFAKSNVPGVDALIGALEANLSLYLQLLDPTGDGPADPESLGIFAALNELGVTAVRPLILAISRTDDALTGMRRVLQLIVRRMVVGNLGTSSVERKFAEAARVIEGDASWRNGLTLLRELDSPREDFIAALSRRPYNRGFLAFIRRCIVFETMTPTPNGTLQYVCPRQSASSEWSGLSDEELSYWRSTLANSILVDLDRRPRGASSWEGVREYLLPRAIPNEKKDLIEKYETWNPTALEEVGYELAKMAANVWY